MANVMKKPGSLPRPVTGNQSLSLTFSFLHPFQTLTVQHYPVIDYNYLINIVMLQTGIYVPLPRRCEPRREILLFMYYSDWCSVVHFSLFLCLSLGLIICFSLAIPYLCVSSVVDTWEKDIGVHPLDLPLTTCQELLLVLTASTSCLPPSLHSMNSYQVRGPLGNVGRASPLGRMNMTLFDSILLISIIYSLYLVAIVVTIFFFFLKHIFEKRLRDFVTNYF